MNSPRNKMRVEERCISEVEIVNCYPDHESPHHIVLHTRNGETIYVRPEDARRLNPGEKLHYKKYVLSFTDEELERMRKVATWN
jgi:hypothetical protein